jgi:hypothetical protein
MRSVHQKRHRARAPPAGRADKVNKAVKAAPVSPVPPLYVFVFAVVSDADLHLLDGWLTTMKLIAHRIKLLDATSSGITVDSLEVERIVAPQKCAVRHAHEYFMDWVSRNWTATTLYFPLTLHQYPAFIFNRYPHTVVGPGLVRNTHIAPLFMKDPLTSRALQGYTTLSGAWNVAVFGFARWPHTQHLLASTDSSRVTLASGGSRHQLSSSLSHLMSISDADFHTTSSALTQLGLAPSLVIVDASIACEHVTNPRNKAASAPKGVAVNPGPGDAAGPDRTRADIRKSGSAASRVPGAARRTAIPHGGART